jgi:putative transposase
MVEFLVGQWHLPGRWIDNRFIARLWRTMKDECLYLNAYDTGAIARRGIGHWIKYDNADRPHSSDNGLTPNEAYETSCNGENLAA